MISVTKRRLPPIRCLCRCGILLFVVCFHATHADAGEWWVRPAGSHHGASDGSTYGDAWPGLAAVQWGDGGVKPGDTLWVCGLHLHDIADKYSYAKGAIPIISGGDTASRITVRGDCPGDPGVIWGAGRLVHGNWRDEGGGVWSIPLIADVWAGDWIFQDIGAGGSHHHHTVLAKAGTLDECRRQPGSHYSPSYTKTGRLYIHCTDGKSPTGRISANSLGYRFALDDHRYLTFEALTLFNPARIPHTARLNHIRWQHCKLIYGMHSLLGFHGESLGLEVLDCELAWAGNGIYTIQQNWQGGTAAINRTSSSYRFIGNHIHHIGVRRVNWNRDAHGIGIQGGRNGLIDGNLIEHCGSGIALYAYTEQVLTDTIVRRNTVRNIHTTGGATGYGIFTMCNNDSLSDKSGNQFYHNLVVNAPVGLRFQFEQRQDVFNNLLYRCGTGLASTRNYQGLGAHVWARNNMVVESRDHHVRWVSGATRMTIDFANNLYYPTDGKRFLFGGRDLGFSHWRALQRAGSRFDTDSVAATPLFVDDATDRQSPDDFRPKAGSPTRNAGSRVPLTADRDGTPITPPPDIGLFELPAAVQ